MNYKIKKNELLEPINFNRKVNKGDIIAKLVSKTITAPFAGIVGKRGISGSSLGSENTIILTLDDSKKVLCDLKIPEVYAAILKKTPAPYLPIITKAITKKNIIMPIVIFFDLFIYFSPHSAYDPS